MFVLAGLILVALFFVISIDDRILRAYWNLDLPWWTFSLENAFSTWIHRTILVVGILLLAIGRPQHRWHVALAMGGQLLIVQTLKAMFGRVRPCDVVDPSLWLGPTMIHDGFPSGHATAIWTVTFILIRRFPRELPVVIPLAIAVCWARVHADAHYLSDVIAGVALAWLIDQVSWRLAVKWGSRDEAERKASRGLFVATCPVRTTVWTVLLALAIVAPGLVMLTRVERPRDIEPAEAEALVAAMYTRILKREADAPGLLAHATKLADEDLPIVRLREIAISPENVQRLIALEDDRAQVTDVYQSLLARDPTEAEFDRAAYLFGEYDEERRALALRVIMTRIFHGL